jgi:hypothetical protein
MQEVLLLLQSKSLSNYKVNTQSGVTIIIRKMGWHASSAWGRPNGSGRIK